MTAPSRTCPMTQSLPCSTDASMASASKPVGVRLWETWRTEGAMPAAVSASVTWAVAGFGDSAASAVSVLVTVCRTVSVAATSAAGADGVPDVSASGSAVSVSVAAGTALVADLADGAGVPDWTAGNVAPTQPVRPATSSTAAVASGKRPAAGPPTEVEAAGMAPAVDFCRWSGVRRMVSFCHGPQRWFYSLDGQGTAGGADALPAQEPGGR